VSNEREPDPTDTTPEPTTKDTGSDDNAKPADAGGDANSGDKEPA
jgi:hypothetical protein